MQFMRKTHKSKTYISHWVLPVMGMILISSCDSLESPTDETDSEKLEDAIILEEEGDSLEVIIGTFLGNDQRNYYGDSIGDELNELWKLHLGSGTTNLADGAVTWSGAGWTGQPLVVREKENKYLLLGCYDHNLKKIDARTGNLIWSYEYDDVIKGTGSIWQNDKAEKPENRLVILQGSRLGNQNSLAAKSVYSYRAVSYFTGEELWRMNSKKSRSYSRDVDASAITMGDTAYIGLENGTFISFGPGEKHWKPIESTNYFEPSIFQELPLYSSDDAVKHGGNLVTEASPARIDDHIYIASGSGHVYGYSLKTKSMDWVFDIGADLDGSPVVTSDGCLLVTVEKQYVKGRGGVFKLDPRKSPDDCVVWFFPTGDREFADWHGGVIGSVSVNDSYNEFGQFPYLAAFTGIDGWFYLVNHAEIDPEKTSLGPDAETIYPMPILMEKRNIGPSISTPIFVQNKIVAAGYHGINLFNVDANGKITSTVKKQGVFEASPVADQGKIYIASRNGYLYCLGAEEEYTDGSDLLAKSQSTAKVKDPNLPIKTVSKPKKTVKPLKKSKAKEKPVSATVSQKELKTGSYYLVAGAFGVRGNAVNLVKDFKTKGLDAFITEGPNDLSYVIVGQATSKESIAEEKSKLKNKYGIDAWVYQGN
ncbi:MAG: hypothetical protein Crog4KO_02610 [Crocinitomicaceae bacterium]